MNNLTGLFTAICWVIAAFFIGRANGKIESKKDLQACQQNCQQSCKKLADSKEVPQN